MRVILSNKPFNVSLNKVAADKSISHRAALFSLLTNGDCRIRNYLFADDCLNTLEVIKDLGALVRQDDDKIIITPPKNIISPNKVLECGNSGTLMRLLIGLLASQDGFFVLSGDEYLNKRPMRRINDILNAFGAKINGRDGANYAPIAITGNRINYFKYHNYLKSAQVKTALILAGLLGNGCEITEEELSRNHSENLLKIMNAPISINGLNIKVDPLISKLEPYDVLIPNDPSSVFFFAVLTAISEGSCMFVDNVLLNETRIEAYMILKRMGAKIDFEITDNSYEKIGNIKVQGSNLKAINVDKNISWLIDEIPALSIAFLYADGVSSIKNAKELRVKESDRIKAILNNFEILGVEYEEYDDGFSVVGKSAKKRSVNFNSFADHRIAMSFSLLARDFDVSIDNVDCVNASFSNFYEILGKFGTIYEY